MSTCRSSWALFETRHREGTVSVYGFVILHRNKQMRVKSGCEPNCLSAIRKRNLSSAKKAGCDSHESFFLVKHSHRLNQRSSVSSDALSPDSVPIFTLVQEIEHISPQQKRIPDR